MRIKKITLTSRFVNCQNGIGFKSSMTRARVRQLQFCIVGVRTYFFRFLGQILCTNIKLQLHTKEELLST